MIFLRIIHIFLHLLPSKTTNKPIIIRRRFFSFYLRCFHCRSNDNKTTESNRSAVQRILLEFGLDPRDYTFTSSDKPISDFSRSAFSKYSPQKPAGHSRSSPTRTQGRSLTYAQQPPPPRPIIKRPIPKLASKNEMSQYAASSRRTPPSPPLAQLIDDLPRQEATLSADEYARTIDSLDNPPVKVVKPNNQDVFYRKEIRIRYLQPPTPPPPAPIIIREKHMPPEPPKSVSCPAIVLAIIPADRFASHCSFANENRKHALHHR